MSVSLGPMLSSYAFDASRPETQICGLRAHAAHDPRSPDRPLLAIEAAPGLPPRPMLFAARGMAVPHSLMPLDFGPGEDAAGRPAWFMLCPAPPGPALPLAAWPETELLDCLLRPACEALIEFAERDWTHRAIRPDNLFRAGSLQPITLGPCWAAPPAYHQPALFEPPYAAACRPALRGNGTIADDIYALGVTLLALALGRLPLAGMSDAAILRRKLDQGSYAALVGEARISPLLADLLRIMLAEDPEHRPSPALLRLPREARARRVPARLPLRAQRAFEFGAERAWSARELAHGFAAEPERAAKLLRAGAVARWVRLALGDPGVAARIEEIAATADPADNPGRAACVLTLRAAMALDPLAPLCWRGESLLPDGIGTGLAAVSAGLAPATLGPVLADTVAEEVAAIWRGSRSGGDGALLRQQAREWRGWLAGRGLAGGSRRLLYALNPGLACGSPLLGGRAAVRLMELLPALEAAAAGADRRVLPFDADIAAFLAARAEAPLQAELARLPALAAQTGEILALFAQLQARFHPDPLPGLAGWLLESDAAGLAAIANRPARARLRDQLAALAAAGQLGPMAGLADNLEARRADRDGQARAAARCRAIQTELAGIAAAATAHDRMAGRLGHEIAVAVGALTSFGAVLLAAFA